MALVKRDKIDDMTYEDYRGRDSGPAVAASAPMAEESRPGGSYLDFQPGEFKLDLVPEESEPEPETAQADQGQTPYQKTLNGRASDVNDFDLTISGIADGDPVGMETFDLGFFEDGTPAIVINGANVPIRHDQWMSLMSMRNKTREETRYRTEFAIAKRNAIGAINKIDKAVQLPAGMAPLLYAQAEMSPEAALGNLSKIYLSMQTSGGRDLMGSIAVDLQKQRNENSIGFMLRDGGEETVVTPGMHPSIPSTTHKIKLPSLRDRRVSQLAKSSNPRDQITAHAYMKLEDFLLDPRTRQMNPTDRIGIFDRLAREQDRTSPMSLWSRLQHIAAFNGGDWPAAVPMEPPPSFMVSQSGVPSFNPAEQQRWVDYLMRLDQWSASAFGYDLSTPEALSAVSQELALVGMQHQQSMMQQQQQQPSSTTEHKSEPSGRQRATR